MVVHSGVIRRSGIGLFVITGGRPGTGSVGVKRAVAKIPKSRTSR